MRIDKIEKVWSADSIRTMCIRNRYFTAGCSEDYTDLLDFVERTKPNTMSVLYVAEVIERYSELNSGQSREEDIESIVFSILNGAITYCPTVH